VRLQLQFKHYLDELRSRSNDAVSLNTLPNDVVDPLDIAQAALELGLEGAEGFIDAFPYMATQTLRAMLEEFGH
jgi:hypothetical protein